MKKSLAGIDVFTFGQDLVFEAFIQYKVGVLFNFFYSKIISKLFQEYIGFVKAMNALRGMKLLYKDR